MEHYDTIPDITQDAGFKEDMGRIARDITEKLDKVRACDLRQAIEGALRTAYRAGAVSGFRTAWMVQENRKKR